MRQVRALTLAEILIALVVMGLLASIAAVVGYQLTHERAQAQVVDQVLERADDALRTLGDDGAPAPLDEVDSTDDLFDGDLPDDVTLEFVEVDGVRVALQASNSHACAVLLVDADGTERRDCDTELAMSSGDGEPSDEAIDDVLEAGITGLSVAPQPGGLQAEWDAVDLPVAVSYLVEAAPEAYCGNEDAEEWSSHGTVTTPAASLEVTETSCVRVRAVVGDGQSPWEVSDPETPLAAMVDAPTDVTAHVDPDNEEADVAWEPPANLPDDGDVDGVVRYEVSDGDDTTTVVDRDATEVTLPSTTEPLRVRVVSDDPDESVTGLSAWAHATVIADPHHAPELDAEVIDSNEVRVCATNAPPGATLDVHPADDPDSAVTVEELSGTDCLTHETSGPGEWQYELVDDGDTVADATVVTSDDGLAFVSPSPSTVHTAETPLRIRLAVGENLGDLEVLATEAGSTTQVGTSDDLLLDPNDHSDLDLAAGATVELTARAYTDDGDGDLVTATRTITPVSLARPAWIAPDASPARVDASWAAVSRATSYTVTLISDADGEEIAEVTTSGTAHTFTALDQGDYRLEVVAHRDEVTSDPRVSDPFEVEAIDEVYDDFSRVGDLDESITSDGVVAWDVQSGSWETDGDTATTSTSENNDPFATVDVGRPNVRIDMGTMGGTSGGGDTVYLRAEDEDNWLRVRYRHRRVSSTNTSTQTRERDVWTTTSYDWECGDWYQRDHCDGDWYCNQTLYHSDANCDGDDPVRSITGSCGAECGVDHGGNILYEYTSDNQPCDCEGTTTTHTGSWSSWPSCSGSTSSSTCTSTSYGECEEEERTCTTTSWSSRYYLYLEEKVDGNFNRINTDNMGTSSSNRVTSIQVEADGDEITVYRNGESSPRFTATASNHTDVTTHGVGRGGPTDRSGSDIDYIHIDVNN